MRNLFLVLVFLITTSSFAEEVDCKTALNSVSQKLLDDTNQGKRTFKAERENYSLDANTRNDLKVLDRLYPQLNKTRTYFGAKRLAWLLQNPYLDVAEIQERQNAVRSILADPVLRKNLGESLDRLKAAADKSFAQYFTDLTDPKNPARKISIVSGILTGAAVYMGINSSLREAAAMLVPMTMINANVMQNIRFERIKLQDFKDILREGGKLAKMLPENGPPALDDIKNALNAIEDSTRPDSPARSLWSLGRMLGAKNPFAWLVDILYGQGDWTLPVTQKKIIDEKQQLTLILSAIAELDTYVALADYTSQAPDQLIFPEVVAGDTAHIRMEQAHNPYLFTKNSAKSVPNDIAMNGRNDDGLPNFVVLTGPNAGGKSTFLKTVALISIAAQIGATVPAKLFVFTPMEVMTNIDLTDSLEEGKSFYRAEGARLAQIANRAQKSEKLLVIMDEILLGTNPQDRHALEKQVIKYLAQTAHLSLLATHDIKVTKLADKMPGILPLKVDETRDPVSGEFRFTFKMIPGVSQTSTAFEVLRAEGVPSQIVDDAYAERYGSERVPKFQ